MIEIFRVVSGPDGTFGVFVIDGRPVCLTAEPPWKNNKKNMSCIPPGKYKCSPHSGPKYKNVRVLKDVPGRETIIIHNGNFPLKDTEGCILVGASFSMEGIPCVDVSLKTLKKLMAKLPQNFDLVIHGVVGL